MDVLNNEVSIIMSVYNENISEIKDSINSILNQSFKNFEFIIVDDNPNNSEIKELITKYQKQDKRIKIIFNDQNIGLALSLNKAISNSHGKYIARMDADDISMKDRIKIQYCFMENNKHIDICCSNKRNINSKGELIESETIYKSYNDYIIKKTLKYMSMIVHPTVFMRKEAVDLVNGYRNFSASQDYDLWLRMKDKGLNFYCLADVLLYYRIREDSISKKNPYKQWLIHEYIYKLSKQREQNIADKFSEKDLNEYLIKNKFDDKHIVNKFKVQLNRINSFKNSIKEKNILKTVLNLLLICISQKRIRTICKYNIICTYYKNKKEK